MAQYRPQFFTIKVVAIVLNLVGFHFERLKKPHPNVGYHQERYHFSSWFSFSQQPGVAWSSYSIKYENCLKQNLSNLEQEIIKLI